MKISEFSSLGTFEATAVMPVVFGGTNYKQTLSVAFAAPNISYTPGDAGDWATSPPPSAVNTAIDELAERINVVEGSGGVSDGDKGDIVITAGVWRFDSSIDFSGKQLNHGTLDDVTVQNSVLDDVVIDTTSAVDVVDNVFHIHDNADLTKKIAFQVGGVTTGTTRTLTVQDVSGTIALRTPNIQAVTSSATVTPTFDNDLVKITAQAAALALANPTGTAIPGLGMVIRIKDNGTARAISWDTQYRAIGITLPTTTVVSKTTYVAMIYNSDDTKWDCVATGTEA